MHAVLINHQSLDLIATNNGGIRPDVEAWGSYFILPTDPNDHAEIVSADDFDKNYTLIEGMADDRFVRIVPVVQFVKREPYSIDRDELAHMIACHTSGLHDAIAEQDDYDIADKFIKELDDSGPCPRCGGDHSWCQNVQSGEFG